MRKPYLALGFICVGLGAVGAVLPVLPTVPFLLLASYFFGKGSSRWQRWFTGTRLYQNHLRDFSENRAMTLRDKLLILIPVTAMLAAVMILVNNPIMTAVLLVVILAKYYFFLFRIRTKRAGEEYGNPVYGKTGGDHHGQRMVPVGPQPHPPKKADSTDPPAHAKR